MINLSNKSGWSTNPQIAVSQNNVYVVWTNNAQEKYGQIFFTKVLIMVPHLTACKLKQ